MIHVPKQMVAEVGFEPHDLRVMSPTSYQAALLRDIEFYPPGGAGNRDRTGTILSYHGILSPGRLPVPPHRQNCPPGNLRSSLFALNIIPYLSPFVNPFLKNLSFFPKTRECSMRSIPLFCFIYAIWIRDLQPALRYPLRSSAPRWWG